MKYYSEILDKYFDTQHELRKAERNAKESTSTPVEKQECKTENKVCCEKKQLAKAVQQADEKLETAYKNFELAKEQAAKILEKANKQAEELLKPAKEKVNQAQKDKYQAVVDFNKKYGVYTTTYTGSKAIDELSRMTKWIDDIICAIVL